REDRAAQVSGRLAPGEDHTLEERDDRVANDEFGADLATRPESAAGGAGAEGRVERELPGLELRHAGPAMNAGVTLAEEVTRRVTIPAVMHDLDDTVRGAERGLDRIG